jgi:hypothetical protein
VYRGEGAEGIDLLVSATAGGASQTASQTLKLKR